MHNLTTAKPFVKWAGGKTQLLAQLDNYLPCDLVARPFTYIEPFVGGGAMLLHMLGRFPHIGRVVINDINPHLIRAYHTIKCQPRQLIDALNALQNKYLPLNHEHRTDMFLTLRTRFNQGGLDDLHDTACFIFLNKTCFNGLYRENSHGEFNVPHGRYAHPVICNAPLIMADSQALNRAHVQICNGDFAQIAAQISPKEVNFIYMDPPYRPLTATASFTAYSRAAFNDRDQQRLANFCRSITATGCLWMLSNSDCSAHDPSDRFFEQLYAGFTIARVTAKRAINSNPAKRGRLTELLIYNNYETVTEAKAKHLAI